MAYTLDMGTVMRTLGQEKLFSSSDESLRLFGATAGKIDYSELFARYTPFATLLYHEGERNGTLGVKPSEDGSHYMAFTMIPPHAIENKFYIKTPWAISGLDIGDKKILNVSMSNSSPVAVKKLSTNDLITVVDGDDARKTALLSVVSVESDHLSIMARLMTYVDGTSGSFDIASGDVASITGQADPDVYTISETKYYEGQWKYFGFNKAHEAFSIADNVLNTTLKSGPELARQVKLHLEEIKMKQEKALITSQRPGGATSNNPYLRPDYTTIGSVNSPHQFSAGLEQYVKANEDIGANGSRTFDCAQSDVNPTWFAQQVLKIRKFLKGDINMLADSKFIFLLSQASRYERSPVLYKGEMLNDIDMSFQRFSIDGTTVNVFNSSVLDEMPTADKLAKAFTFDPRFTKIREPIGGKMYIMVNGEKETKTNSTTWWCRHTYGLQVDFPESTSMWRLVGA